MERAETHANEGLICQKHLKVDGRLCQTPWVQPARSHFKYEGVVYSFARIMFRARVSPFTQGSQISLADPGSASVKPKHLDKKQKTQPFTKSSSQTFFTMYLFTAYCLRRVFHLHNVKYPDERLMPFHNSSRSSGTRKTQCSS